MFICLSPSWSIHLSERQVKPQALDLFFMLRGEVGSFRLKVFISPAEESCFLKGDDLFPTRRAWDVRGSFSNLSVLLYVV